MRVCGREIESKYALEFGNPRQGFVAERRFSFESMENDALDEIAEAQVVVVGQRTQDLEQTLFDADSSLYALHDEWNRAM